MNCEKRYSLRFRPRTNSANSNWNDITYVNCKAMHSLGALAVLRVEESQLNIIAIGISSTYRALDYVNSVEHLIVLLLLRFCNG